MALEPGAGAPFRGYTITRMTAEGFVGVGKEQQAVRGLAWLEHLWGDVPLPLGPIVWDRLQLHLDDGTDLSLIRTVAATAAPRPRVAGFAVGPDGRLEPDPSNGCPIVRAPRDLMPEAAFRSQHRTFSEPAEASPRPAARSPARRPVTDCDQLDTMWR